MTTLFVSAFLLGLLFNAAPGAVFAETVRQGLGGGFRAAFAVQVGSLAGDGLWAVLGLAGAGLLLQVEALRVPLGVAGALYLTWLARDSWRAARENMALTAGGKPGRALRSGVLLSVTNPQNLAYWAALGSVLASLGVQDPKPADYAVFFAGFMASSIVWCFVCATLVHALLRRAGPGWHAITHRLCAIALLALALASLRDLMVRAPRPLAAQPSPTQGTPWQP